MVDGREMCIYLELKHIIIDEMTLPSTQSLAISLSLTHTHTVHTAHRSKLS